MKIRQTLTLIFASGLLFFSSCLKDDPNGSNTTLFYGHQDIPNINYYMPRPLLKTLNDMDSLHFGENPPKMLFDSCYNNDTTIVFAFSNHCFGMTSLSFKEQFDDGTKVSSNTDDTYKIMTENKRWEDFCLNDTLLPIFFDTAFNGTAAKDPEVLRHAYIMGKDPEFTLYYYEVRKEPQQLQPLNAVILSGTVVYKQFPIDTIKPVHDRITRDSIPNDTINNDPPVVNDTTNINPSDNDSIVIVYDSIPQYLIDVKMGVKTLKYFPKNNTQAPTIPDINIKRFDTLFIKTSKNR